MKVNEQWLREWVDASVGVEQWVDQLTMAGLEVDALESLDAQFSGVVVGEILAAEPHPDAQKLRVCLVSDGADQVQVVCGAPNAAVGLKIPFARVGARLPGGLEIKKAKLRGVESFGMLCGASELNLSDDDSGLLVLPESAPLGVTLEQYLSLKDHVIELDITPNRGDCFSVLGIARELAVINQMPLNMPEIAPQSATLEDVFPVQVEAMAACPRYCGRVLRGIDNTVPTPIWMQERLRRAGLRSIDAVVDVTNYVLLELGQPMHAFDLERLQSGIVVRLAKAGETLTLLDQQELRLRDNSLVIADESGPLALAGIMGGEGSGVKSSTQDLLLESAFFAPALMAGQARAYGLHTDSSHRFERGVDFTAQRRAIERATDILLGIVGGSAGPVIECVSDENLPQASTILLRRKRIRRMLGLELEDNRVEEILERLGFAVASNAEGWLVTPPPWRFDMEIEADLLEEIARIYGYDNLPVQSLLVPLELKASSESRLAKADVRRQMVARDYQEVITYSFIAQDMAAMFAPDLPAVPLSNPISADMGVMRTSLWPGLVSTVLHNTKRQQGRVRLFETGLTFLGGGEDLQQTPTLAAAVYGSRYAEAWSAEPDNVDFFDLKGDLQALLALTGRADAFSFQAAAHPALHDGQSAAIYLRERQVGRIGRLHPRIQRQFGLAQAVFLFEVELQAVLETTLPSFSELSRYPEVRRDLAVIVDEAAPVEAVLKCIRDAAGTNLRQLTLFDTYQGKGIEKQRKSLGLGLTFRDQSRTLNDSEINSSVERVVEILQDQFSAVLRD
jgi:phenylalanyl-tRNA synthetase beta chain